MVMSPAGLRPENACAAAVASNDRLAFSSEMAGLGPDNACAAAVASNDRPVFSSEMASQINNLVQVLRSRQPARIGAVKHGS
jgi:hypothetical protein